MKNRKAIYLGLFVLGVVALGGLQYFLYKQTPPRDLKFIKEVAPKVDPETGAVLGTPAA